jgi:hypothetical protein
MVVCWVLNWHVHVSRVWVAVSATFVLVGYADIVSRVFTSDRPGGWGGGWGEGV